MSVPQDTDLEKIIKPDFEEWSGGFPPESPDQIQVYIDAARPSDTDAEEVRALLTQWMNEQD
jgi:hypothetical protein